MHEWIIIIYIIGAIIMFCLALITNIEEGKITLADLIADIMIGFLSWAVIFFCIVNQIFIKLFDKLNNFVIWQKKNDQKVKNKI